MIHPVQKESFSDLRLAAGHQRIVSRLFQDPVELSTPDADVTAAKQRERERILQQASERESVIVALYPDDSHEIRQHPHGCFRTMDLCFDRQLLRTGRLHIDRLARSPAEAT